MHRHAGNASGMGNPIPRQIRVIFLVMALFGLGGAGTASLAPIAPVPSSAPLNPLASGERAIMTATLQTSGDHGLSVSVRSGTDEALITAILSYATAMRGQRIDPTSINFRWAYSSAPADLRSEFNQAVAGHRLGAWLASLWPADPQYAALVASRRRYAEIVRQAGWTPLPPQLRLKLGDHDPAVVQLMARLRTEGYAVAPPSDPTAFDLAVQDAVLTFQSRHGLKVDGVVGASTVAALNVPAIDRLATIDANLERLRWIAPETGLRIVVDIAGAELTVVDQSVAPLSMRVIIGDRKHQTPLFASAIETVVFNPPWDVPDSIAVAELWPREAREPGYLARSDFQNINGHLRQAPGPLAALGRVKFDMDSPFGVFLHDTPYPSLFDRDQRELSHGCIRLQKPRELAALLLGKQGWTAAQIDQIIATGATSRTALIQPVPVVMTYRTAVVDENGAIIFRPDVYGWDTALIAALRR